MEVIMATTTRTRSSGTAKRTTRPRTRKATPAATPGLSASTRSRVNAVSKDAKAVAREIQTRTTNAISSVPVNRTTVSIAIGALAAAALAGIGALLGRERLMKAATASREKLRQTADDLSTVAHEKIDQARDNIHKLRTRNSETPAEMPKDDIPMAM
jgi:hypothetical protein